MLFVADVYLTVLFFRAAWRFCLFSHLHYFLLCIVRIGTIIYIVPFFELRGSLVFFLYNIHQDLCVVAITLWNKAL